jgi:hypothetical protein
MFTRKFILPVAMRLAALLAIISIVKAGVKAGLANFDVFCLMVAACVFWQLAELLSRSS